MKHGRDSPYSEREVSEPARAARFNESNVITSYTTADFHQFSERVAIPLWRGPERSAQGRDSGVLTFGDWPEETHDRRAAQHNLPAPVRGALSAERQFRAENLNYHLIAGRKAR